MKLSKEDLEIIDMYDGNTIVERVDLSKGAYYVKFGYGIEDNKKMIFTELLGTRIFNLVGIKCAQYQYIPEYKCLISPDLDIPNKMYWSYEFGFGSIALEHVLEGVYSQKRVGNGFTNPRQLSLSVEIMHFIDILFSNIDRHANNFGFYIDKGGYGELVVLDNEGFLSCFDKPVKPYAFSAEKLDEEIYNSTKIEEAKKFFEVMSEDMRQLVPKYLEMFTPKRVEYLIKGLEVELDMEFCFYKKVMKDYKKNYNQLCRVFNYKKNNRISLYKK